MITRQELGAKILSHHSGRTSILVVMSETLGVFLLPAQTSPSSCPALCRASTSSCSKSWMAGTSPAMTKDRLRAPLERVADQVVKRDRAAAADEKVERHHGPHQGVFEPELVPEILADPPALEIGHDQEKQDRKRGDPGEQTEREQWPADKLRERDRGRPDLARPIAIVVELGGKLGDAV